eukprot:916602_1
MNLRYKHKFLLLGSLVAVPCAVNCKSRQWVLQKCEPPSRFFLCALIGAHVTADYYLNAPARDSRSELSRSVRSMIHQRSADQMKWLFQRLGGIFIKTGQHVATLNHVLPKEYTTTMSVFQDQAPPRPYSAVVQIFEEDMGILPSEVFSEFDEEPIASASLAQVHRAVTKDGKEVAVKVQYPRLHDLFRTDLRTMDILTRWLIRVFPDYDLRWLVKEIKSNLLAELDFEQEGRRAERQQKIFVDHSFLHIPKVYWDLTRQRILTMEYINGYRVDDVHAIQKDGFDTNVVAQLLCELYGEMIHCSGFIHCDPHPGNILVREHPDFPGQPQLVLLDHGMYREVSEDFRMNYCKLWRAMITHDMDELESSCASLGIAPKNIRYIPLIITARPQDSRQRLGMSMTSEQKRALMRELGEFEFKDFNEFIEDLPRDLLMVLRAHDYVRAINKELGGKTKDRLMTMFQYAIQGLYRSPESSATQLPWWRRLQVWFYIFFLRIQAWTVEALHRMKLDYAVYGNLKTVSE